MLLFLFLFVITLGSAEEREIELLFDWCHRDPQCAKSYHIVDMLQEAEEAPEFPILEEAQDVFEFLAERWVPELRPPSSVDSFDDMRDVVERRFLFKYHHSVPRSEIEQSVRRHWLTILRLSASENREVHCGANQRLVVSHETMDAFCDCVGNRNCDESGHRRSRWNIAELATLSLSVLIAFWFILSMIYSVKKIHFYQQYRMGQRSSEDTHAHLIKDQ